MDYYERLLQFYPIIDGNQKLKVVKIYLELKQKEVVYEGEAFYLFANSDEMVDITNKYVLDMWQSNADPEVLVILIKDEEE